MLAVVEALGRRAKMGQIDGEHQTKLGEDRTHAKAAIGPVPLLKTLTAPR
jgi:hypothetical protein